MSGELAIALAALFLAAVAAAVIAVRTRRVVATPTERAVHAALHTASLAARALRHGLDTDSAQTAAPFLRSLTGTDGVALFDGDGRLLAQDPPQGPIWEPVVNEACEHAARDAISGQRRVLTQVKSSAVVAQPLLDREQRCARRPGGRDHPLTRTGDARRRRRSRPLRRQPDRTRRAGCVACPPRPRGSARTTSPDQPALHLQRAQHDCLVCAHRPDRARELILEFADFTRYSFRAAGQYTTLAEELRNIDRYLNLERARFGSALTVRLQVAPEVLNVVVPFLALQPLVENAVRHGFAGKGGGSVEIIARDEGSECVITVEDDGVGMDPETLRAGPGDALADGRPAEEGHSAHVGLTNVDHRLRAAFGNDYGLVVETAIGAGTKVVMRVPKFRSGVRASGGAFG